MDSSVATRPGLVRQRRRSGTLKAGSPHAPVLGVDPIRVGLETHIGHPGDIRLYQGRTRCSDRWPWIGVPLSSRRIRIVGVLTRDVENWGVCRKWGLLGIGARCACQRPDTVLGARQYAVASHFSRRRRDPTLPAPFATDILSAICIREWHGRGQAR
jgi:hypothetical protein